MKTKTETDFSRGPYGEIFPPPLLGGVTPAELDEIVHEMVDDEALLADVDLSQFHDEAMLYLHQQNLLDVLAGRREDPDVADLREAVLQGEPLSLRPLGHEDISYRTFAPVLQRISDNSWRLGVESYGQTATVAGDNAGVALRRARQIYTGWAEAELTT